MQNKIVASCVLAVAAVLLMQSASRAQSPVSYTTVQVQKMHCAECAKKIAGRVYKVAGVKEVRAEVPKNTIYVVPQANQKLSPKALWTAVMQSGFTPVKLHGPSGVFTSAPKN